MVRNIMHIAEVKIPAVNRMFRHYYSMIVLLVAASCNQHMPAPPTGANPESEEQYFKTYYQIHHELYQKISLEIDSRRDPLLTRDTSISESKEVISDPGKSKIYVNDKGQVFAHRDNISTDKMIFEETGDGFRVGVRKSVSGRYFFITSSNGNTSETRFLPTDLSNIKPFLIQKRENGCRYHVEHFGSDIFWIFTDKYAPNRKLMQAMVSHPEESYWLPVVPERDSIYLEDFTLLDEKYIFLLERYQPGVGIRIYSREKNDEGAIRFKEPDGDLQFVNYEPDKEKILLKYTSLLSPVTFYEFNIKTNRLGAQRKTEIKNYRKDDYSSDVIRATASDGSRIPITLVYKNGLGKIDGSNPMLLIVNTGTKKPGHRRFNPAFLSLLDRGFYIAEAYLNKNKAVSDLACCTEYLFSQKLCSPGFITLSGFSDGVNVILNSLKQQPEIYQAVIFQNLPEADDLTGLFNKDMKRKDYPAALIFFPDSSKTNQIKALKLAEKLREFAGGDKIILLGPSGHSDNEDPSALFCTFILDQNQIKK